MAFEELVEQAHADTNAIRAEKGLAPMVFANPNRKESPLCPGYGKHKGVCVKTVRSAGYCSSCYAAKRYYENKTSGRRGTASAPSTPRVSTDDFGGLIRILDAQIAAVTAKLEKLREARRTLAAL